MAIACSSSGAERFPDRFNACQEGRSWPLAAQINMNAGWLQDRLKKAEELLHAVDRTAKAVSTEIGVKKAAGKIQQQPTLP
jgi:hypothetical protein